MGEEEKDLEKISKVDPAVFRQLTSFEAEVIENCGTEAPFTGEYNNHWEKGTFHCKRCDAPLFASNTKFDAGCGWPSFFEPLHEGAVRYLADDSLGYRRIEVRCAACDGHLGHVFADAPEQPTGKRYCTNSVSLIFKADE